MPLTWIANRFAPLNGRLRPCTRRRRTAFPASLVLCAAFFLRPSAVDAAPAPRSFRAGVCAMDINPTNFPVHVLGMFTDRTADTVADPLYARCLVLDNGAERIALAVVDSCMMPRDLIDRAKELVHAETGLRTDRILISATHTHSAPSAMGGLGTPPDTNYAAFLPGRIADGIARAVRRLAPARIGWTVTTDAEHTHTRRWIYRPDKMLKDPFGELSVRANMHPGYLNPDVIGPSGPSDPGITILSVQTAAGLPVALLANYSMHYYESPMLSADYYGRFAEKIARLVGADPAGPFVGIMSQGTSGDQMWMDYGRPQISPGLEAYSEAIARKVHAAYQTIQYHDWVPLAMRETKRTFNFRLCNETRLAWARKLVAEMHGRLPRTLPEVYACEQGYLRERPTAEVKLQAIRIGDAGIAAFPNEVYALTGLKIKAQSPLQPTFNIGLANGAEGYIPPPEQHRLGGYTTWAARTAGLEPGAEPSMVAELLRLLEEAAGRPRRRPAEPPGPYTQAVLGSKPVHFWRWNGFDGQTPADATGARSRARFTDGVVFHLEGPDSPAFGGPEGVNRAPHFAGGHFEALPGAGSKSRTIELWFWNGLPHDARGLTGVLWAREGQQFIEGLGIGGTNGYGGRLVYLPAANSNLPQIAGGTTLGVKTWHHVVFVRHGDRVAAHLDGNLHPDLEGEVPLTGPQNDAAWLFGGTRDRRANFEGKLDELALYRRALSADEIAAHYTASGMTRAQ